MKLSLMSDWMLFSTRLIVIILFVKYMHLWLTTLSLSLYSSIPSWTVFCWYDHLQKGNNKNAPDKKTQPLSSTKKSWKKGRHITNPNNALLSSGNPWELPMHLSPIKMTPEKLWILRGLPNPYPNPSNFQPFHLPLFPPLWEDSVEVVHRGRRQASPVTKNDGFSTPTSNPQKNEPKLN